MGIGSVGATVFFQVGLCTPLRIMFVATLKLKLQTGAEKPVYHLLFQELALKSYLL